MSSMSCLGQLQMRQQLVPGTAARGGGGAALVSKVNVAVPLLRLRRRLGATAAAAAPVAAGNAGSRPLRLSITKASPQKAGGGGKEKEKEKKEPATSVNAEKSGAWTIGEVHHKLRLDRALKVLLGGASEKFVDRALRAGCVSHNGRVVRVDQGKNIYVKHGDKVFLRKLAPSSLHELPDAEIRTRLLFEDDHLMVLDKPSGLASAPTPSEPYNAVSALEDFLARRDGRPTTLRNVHRLDKETSGCLILAKTAVVAAAIGAQFKGNRVSKTYWAVLDGVLDGPSSGLWSDRHDIDSNNHAFILPADSEEGKTAKTRFEVLETLPEATVVELRPSTGRMHQLRAQTAFRRAPVAGDTRYGEPGARSGPAKPPRLCLHCAALTLAHPVEQGRVLELRAPVPEELVGHVARLRAAAEAGQGQPPELPHEEVLKRLATPQWPSAAASAAAKAAAQKRAQKLMGGGSAKLTGSKG